MGYGAFTSEIDAIVMGRNTFDTVHGFDMDWPYEKPVFVLSNTMTLIPESLKGKVFLVKGGLKAVLSEIHALGFERLYVDGGATIQNFLKEDLIDDLYLTTIPILLGGGGFHLFAKLTAVQAFELKSSKVLIKQFGAKSFCSKLGRK